MTKFEKPKNTPPTKAAPNAAAKLVPVTRLSGILFLQHLGRLQAIGDAIKVHRCGPAAPARKGQPARRRPVEHRNIAVPDTIVHRWRKYHSRIISATAQCGVEQVDAHVPHT